MLKAMDMPSIRLLTNNPDKTDQLGQYGIEIESTIPTGVFLNPNNRKYLEAKVRHKTSHHPLLTWHAC